MKLDELIEFLNKAKKEYGGDTEVNVHFTDSIDPYAVQERVLQIDNATASSSMSMKNSENTAQILLYVERR